MRNKIQKHGGLFDKDHTCRGSFCIICRQREHDSKPDTAFNLLNWTPFTFSSEELKSYEPMLAKEGDPLVLARLYGNDQWVAEEKFDGSRYLAYILEKGVRLFSRHISKIDGNYVEKSHNIPHITHQTYTGLEGTILDGEITIPGGDFGNVIQVMGTKDPQQAVEKQKQMKPAQYNAFDILAYKGKDVTKLPLIERRKILEEAVKEMDNPYVVLVKQVTQDKEAYYREILSRGGEGLILKNIQSTYRPGLRDINSWVKAKKSRTYDVIIMGYEDPEQWTTNVKEERVENSHWKKGWIASFIFGVYKDGKLTQIGTTSGMPDSTRKEVSDNRKKYIGQVIEIEGQQVLRGAIRHPRFIRFRPDANTKECTWDKLQGGER